MEALNDSKLIGVCIYNVLILSVLGTAIGFILDSDPNMNYGFRSGIVMTGVILTIVIMFVPKVMAVQRGDNVVGTVLDAGGGTAKMGAPSTEPYHPSSGTTNVLPIKKATLREASTQTTDDG